MRTPRWLFTAAASLSLVACSSGVGRWNGDGGSHGDGGEGGGGGESGAGGISDQSGVGGGPHHTGGGAGDTASSSTGGGVSTGTGAGAGGSSAEGGGPASTGSGPSGPGSTGAGGASEGCAGTIAQVPGCYWEPVCPDAALNDIDSSYSPGGWLAAALEATNRRYPSARCLFDMYKNDVGNFADTGDFGALCESMMTMMHEETHGYDYEHAFGNDHFSYFIRCDLSLEVPWIQSFGRSEILPYVQGDSTNLYDGTYLTGDQGTYGWVEVLDEWNAYLNGMAAIGVVGDQVPSFGISGTDGALAFAYYAELYLKVARTAHPDVYGAIKADAQFRDLLKLQWNRMHFFLAVAEKYPKLSIEADGIKQLVYAPENQGEIEKITGPLKADACN